MVIMLISTHGHMILAISRSTLHFEFSQAMSAKTAPPPGINFAISAKGVNEIVNELIQKEKALKDLVAALPADQCTFDTVIVPLATLENETNGLMTYYPSNVFIQIDFFFNLLFFTTGRNLLATTLSYISPEKEIRDASVEAEKQIEVRHSLPHVI